MTKTFTLSGANTSVGNVDIGQTNYNKKFTTITAYPTIVGIYANGYGGPSLIGSGYAGCSVIVNNR